MDIGPPSKGPQSEGYGLQFEGFGLQFEGYGLQPVQRIRKNDCGL
jgi:hypothetical protein